MHETGRKNNIGIVGNQWVCVLQGFGDLLPLDLPRGGEPVEPRSTGLPQRPTGPALARTFRISDWPGVDSGFHAAPTSVGIPLLRPCSAQQVPSAQARCKGS